jgi:hypothetical protein
VPPSLSPVPSFPSSRAGRSAGVVAVNRAEDTVAGDSVAADAVTFNAATLDTVGDTSEPASLAAARCRAALLLVAALGLVAAASKVA